MRAQRVREGEGRVEMQVFRKVYESFRESRWHRE